MNSSPTRLLPLDRFGDAQGSIVFGWVAQGVLYARLDGMLGDGLGAQYANRLERAIWAKNDLRFFCDLWQLENYAHSARELLLTVMSTHAKRFQAVDLLVRSTVVRLGVQAAAIMLGKFVHVHARPAEFSALLDTRAPNARRLLQPSIRPGLVNR